MRKRTGRLLNRRLLSSVRLGFTLLLTCCLSMLNGMAYEDLPIKSVQSLSWLNGTNPGNIEFITLDWSILSIPDDPQVGDEVCFEYTVESQAPMNTFSDVIVLKGLDSLLLFPNPVMAGSGTMAFTGSGSFVLTGSGCSVITQDHLDDGFVYCPAVTTGTLDDGGPTDPSTVRACADAVACLDITLSCTDYNISLDTECETLLTPGLLRINTTLPDELIRIRIQEPNGDFRDRPIVGNDDVDGRVKVVVDIPGCPDVAPCWSYANIEYKLGPAQFCLTDTVSCAQQVAMNDPIVTFACGNTEFIRGEVVREDMCKTSKDFIAREIITYAVRDGFGNISDSCTQVRYIRKPNLKGAFDDGDILFPDGQTILSCSEDVFDTDGSILPFFSGVPLWITESGDTLDLTDRALPQACNILTQYEDVIELERNCERRVIRKWLIREWLCEGGFFETPPFFQTIILRDTTPPTISVQSAVIDLTVNESDCTARFTVPDAEVTDNCQPDSTIEVEVQYPGGSSITSVNRNIRLPLGDSSLVEYIARDRCGNISRDSLYVNVVDNTTPVAICLRETVISLTAETARMGVEQFDEDSYDACGIDRTCVVRMDDHLLFSSIDANKDGILRFEDFDNALRAKADALTGCYRDYSAYSYVSSGLRFINIHSLCTPEVRFCCVDAGKDVPVILRAYDMSGNFNECMVMVGVQDKSTPLITCPTDTITISCDFEFDTAGDLDDLFGTIRNGLTPVPIEFPREFLVDSSGPLVNGTFLDNCNLGRVIEERTVDRDSICRTGTIVRRFSVVRGGDTIPECTQLIQIVGDQNNNPLQWAFFPPDSNLVAQDPDDIRNIAVENPPRVKNVGCSLIGLGHRDQFFQFTDGPYCTKIVRTWEVIDWCRNPTGLVELDSIQYIFVTDNEAPEIVFNSPITIPQPLAGDAIELVATATDNVVDNPRWLDWTYEVFSGNATTPFISDTIRYEDFRNSSAVIRLTGLALGDYTINWIVMDKCMNSDTAMQSLTIEPRRSEEEVNVVGQVLYTKGGNMDNVDVFLTERQEVYTDALKTATDLDGVYAFGNMPKGGQYYIDPEKNDDPLNGVSTLDLILIQRHILGLSRLEDPALRIAADVNNDGRVTALDLVELRRLLLGYIDNFSNKDSWTFAFEGQDLEELANGGSKVSEAYYIPELVQDMDISFTGIKTGDVSGDAVGHSTGIADNRSSSVARWSYESTNSNGVVIASIKTNSAIDLRGFQSTMEWGSNMTLSSIQSGVITLEEQHYNISEQGLLTLAYDAVEAIGVRPDDVLFTLVFKTRGEDSDPGLSLDGGLRLTNEVYDADEIHTLELSKEQSRVAQSAELVLAQNTPNPWSETTVIKANIPLSGEVSFRIFDLHNRMIYQETRVVDRGTQQFKIDQDNVSESGVYFFEVEIEGLTARQKMIRVN